MFHPSLVTADLPHCRGELLARGYIRLPALLDERGVAALEHEIERLTDPAIAATSGHFVLRDQAGFVITMNRIDRESDLLFDLARHPEMIKLATAMLGKPALSLHVEYFAKPPGGGTAAPPHQDHAFYGAHFADELAVSIWIALDDIAPEGGALEYADVSPLAMLPHVKSPSPDFDLELAASDAFQFEVVTVERGGALVHHSFTVHRTAPNRSARHRRAVVFNYRGSPYREWLEREGA